MGEYREFMAGIDRGADPPGPPRQPVVGNTVQFTREPFAFREYCARTYGDIVGLEIGGDPTYMLTHPDYVKAVLVDRRDSFCKGSQLQTRLGKLLGQGLLLSESEFWQRQRQLIQPAFYRDRISGYADMMVEYSDRLADEWEDGSRRDVHEDMMGLTLQILAKALFDTDIHGEQGVISDAAEVIVSKFDLSDPATYLPEWVPTPSTIRYHRAIENLEALIYDMIEQRRGMADRPDDLLTWLIEAEADDGTAMADETIRDEVMTFLLAGHETTALALTYTWHLLANNPGVERRLHAELDEMLGGSQPSVEDLFELEYTEHVVRESMRMYPPLHTILREPTEPVTIGGYQLPEGSIVSTPQWVVHRDSRWYDEPDQFRPERWTSDRERPEYAYFPFGGGPRRCIGQQFAMIEAQLILATIAQQYTLDIDAELELSASITVRPAQPIEGTVRKR